jgi:hypothetical protein
MRFRANLLPKPTQAAIPNAISDVLIPSIETISRLPSLRIVEIIENSERMTITLEYQHTDALRGGKVLPAKATLEVDPTRSYVTTRWKVHYAGSGLEVSRVAELTYGPDRSKPYAERTVVVTNVNYGGNVREERLEAVTEYRWTAPPESDFTLSALGLDEPFGVTWERPTPWWLYAGIAAGAVFVLALLVGLVIRRLQARGT